MSEQPNPEMPLPDALPDPARAAGPDARIPDTAAHGEWAPVAGGPAVPNGVSSAPRIAGTPSTPTSERISKREALEIVGQLKRLIIGGSVVAFAVLAGLAAGHVTGVTAAAPGTGSPAAQPSTTAEPDDGGFFGNQPGGFGFGNNGGQPPVSGSSVS